MRLDDEFEYEYEEEGPGRYRGSIPIIYMTLGVSVFVLILLGAIIISNNNKNKASSNYANYVAQQQAGEEAVSEEMPEVGSKRTADDLDIWDMYKDKTTAPRSDASEDDADESSNAAPLPSPSMAVPTASPIPDDEKYNDGKHYKIEFKDGSAEWVTIDTSREKNNYDFTKFVSNDGKLKYMNDGKVASFLGIDVSRYQKDIDFYQVKNAGIEFVMIRAGSRGYQTGQIALDEFFEQNIGRATDAGLDVGVYFYSQAITPEEAVEEANLVIEACKDRKLVYPVAFDMEFVDNDVARIDTLSKDERTAIAAAFINRMVEAGYKTMIYGDDEWLTKRVDLKKLPTVSVWLSDESENPDYPYQYSMWQYSKQGTVYGINGPVDMNVCFIDYSAQ